MRYVKPTSIDSPTVGCLYAVRERKARLWKAVRQVREAKRREPLGGNRSGLQLDLLKLESAHRQALIDEAGCLRLIEQRANELGLTTIKAKAEAA